MSPSEPPGPFGPGDAFERLGVLEALSYGVAWEGKLFRASQAEALTFLELDRAFQKDKEHFEGLLEALLMAAKLSDSSIVASRGTWRDGESVYLVCEALSGISLARAVESLATLGARLSTEAMLRVTGAILAALDQAAKQFPGSGDAPYGHGLLTPENVYLAEGQRVLVRGFGLWPAVARAGLVGPAQARYLAPAQLHGGQASPRSDLFSLAVILFELVCGIPAFDGAPDDEGISSLQEAIEERRKQAEPSLLPLYGAMLACLSQGPAAVPVFRSRLRKAMDTMFLEEFPRERAARGLTLEDLLGRVRPRRAAVVKARPLALERVPAPAPESPLADGLEAPGIAPVEPEARPSPAVATSPPAAVARAFPWRAVTAVLSFGAVVVLAAVLATARSGSRPSPRAVPAAATALVAPFETPAPLPTAPAASPLAGIAPTAGAPIRATPRRRPEAASESPRRVQPAAGGVGASSLDGPGGAGPAVPTSPPPSVPAGSLVPLEAPGLVRPVVAEAPETLRYGATDPRPPVTRTALLEILVDEKGRVRASRILQVESPPPGFSSGVERYLAGLRFRPARVGQAPVRVWMPYELKYLAP